MIHYNDKYLRYIEWEIRTTHDNRMDIEDYTQCECLLELRSVYLNCAKIFLMSKRWQTKNVLYRIL